MFIKNFLILLLSSLCLGQLPELNVTYTDMNQSMRDLALSQSLFLLSNETDAKQMADKLVDFMDSKYGNGWFSLIGTVTDIKGLTISKNTTLQILYNNDKVTIGRINSNNTTNMESFNDVIKTAGNSQFVLISGNTTITALLEQEIKAVLSNSDLVACDGKSLSENRAYHCFEKLSHEFYYKIKKNPKFSGHNIFVSTGLLGHMFTFGEITSYKFSLGDLYIDIRIQ